MNWLTTDDVAALLKLKPQTLKQLRVHGGGPPFDKFGKSVRYEQSALNEWAAQRRCKSTTDAGRLLADSPTGSLNEIARNPSLPAAWLAE
jgi:excisionase family DNA binding protein